MYGVECAFQLSKHTTPHIQDHYISGRYVAGKEQVVTLFLSHARIEETIVRPSRSWKCHVLQPGLPLLQLNLGFG